MSVVGIFDLRLRAPDVDDLDLNGAAVRFPRTLPVTDQIALVIDALWLPFGMVEIAVIKVPSKVRTRGLCAART
jgi:hypothetical protein